MNSNDPVLEGQDFKRLFSAIDACMVRDQHRLRRRLRDCRKESGKEKGKETGKENAKEKPSDKTNKKLDNLIRDIAKSAELVSRRAEASPTIVYPEELPVSQKVDDIKKVLSEHQVIVVAGETGSGKTTQIPKICLELGRGIKGRIGHTQPRRLAARSVANRIAEELNVTGGAEVAHQVRFTDTSTDATYIKLMTDGILLAEIQHDPFLNQYDTIIVDEAHERSLNIDFLLGYLKRLLPRRPDLKLIITSATIDVEKFSKHFDQAPVIEVSGRTFPVEILYRPPLDNDEDLGSSVVNAVNEIWQNDAKNPLPYKDILVFLSGEKEIRDVADQLRKAQLRHTEVLPLYARLSNSEQNRIFSSHTGKRIVLATNVAETSLTVPGIGYVIDAGTARISRYSVRSKVQRLPIEAISQASANQRAGRCGRLAPGVCVRLYSEEDFTARPEFTDTEIMRTHLGSVILQMLYLGLGNIEDFPFVDMPEGRAINDGLKLLEEIQAVDSNRRLTKSGKLIARLPVDPKFGRMILEASEQGCLNDVLIIVSALSIQDPRERPVEKQQAADEKHRQNQHPDSDFLSLVNLWNSYEEERQALSQNQLRKYCFKHFLSYMRMREWREVHRQLHLVCKEMKLKVNKQPGEYSAIHQSLISGLLNNVANRLDDGFYLGARNRKFQIFPGSVLSKKKVKWILAAELVETSQLFARMTAKIEPEWVEKLASHLLKKEYFEPYWSKRQGRVMAYEKVILYGLTLVEKRRVAYSAIAPDICREIFIREALVNLQLNSRVSFYQHNKSLIENILALEERTRRRDILIDEESQFAFYDEKIPADVFDAKSLERWYNSVSKSANRSENKSSPKLLWLSEQDLQRHQIDEQALNLFPEHVNTGSLSLPLDYNFKPGDKADGVSVSVPVAALKQLNESDLDWLVPGLLKDKCIALIKGLPKPIRKHFVPVPDYVDKLLPTLKKEKGDLVLQLTTELKKLRGIDIPLDQWNTTNVDDHLKMNIDVIDNTGEVIDSGRDLKTLQAGLADTVQSSISELASNTIEQEGLTDWSIDDIPEQVVLSRTGLQVVTYPALIDEEHSVSLKLLDSARRAAEATRMGLMRLYLLRSPQQARYLSKNLLRDSRQVLLLNFLGHDRKSLTEQIIQAAYLEVFDCSQNIRSRSDFDKALDAGKTKVIETAEQIEGVLYKLMQEYSAVQKLMKKSASLQTLELHKNIQAQIAELLKDNFLVNSSWQYCKELPRYMKAIAYRLERFPQQTAKDKQWAVELDKLWKRYQERQTYCVQHDIDSPKLEEFRWMIEEYRVSLFAQQLGTKMPVSAKRLEKAWGNLSV